MIRLFSHLLALPICHNLDILEIEFEADIDPLQMLSSENQTVSSWDSVSARNLAPRCIQILEQKLWMKEKKEVDDKTQC